MSAERIEGQIIPTWKLIDGVCKESLAFETAQREGVPETIIRTAEELYLSAYSKHAVPRKFGSNIKNAISETDVNGSDRVDADQIDVRERSNHSKTNPWNQMEIPRKEIESAVSAICNTKLIKLSRKENGPELPLLKCVLIAAKEHPPPSTIGFSSVYLMLRPDRKIYVGQTDDLEGRVRAHRMKEGMQNAAFVYFIVPGGESIACELETLLINQLPSKGFQLTNLADGKHKHFGSSAHSLERSIAMLR